ncbi:histidinol phosphate phosphatase H [Tilletiaria anomala UBC 951]|uniref:Histidinol-phosphatase n=1 Tax=Tilletiaria anomala (strain ATCC 24038 / CBS 436.72 / UBC 951) TaxID=1037660 RepID=A0A066V9C7_TILAU|nr:histidinol phosphate phosphatase H [Tilletiaria anomala UBC 951]KDN35215.1 histidinol phosphate phosphatase H [Tilletiaria anomala UBC 951]
MHSHHSHSGQFCSHAADQLSDVLDHAAHLGFTHFHLSEHCPRALSEHLYPEEREAGLEPADLESRFIAYLAQARSLQAVWKDKLHILVGCETENLKAPAEMGNDSIDHLINFLERLSIRQGKLKEGTPAACGLDVVDYLVGSLHHVRGVPIDFDLSTFTSALRLFEVDNRQSAQYNEEERKERAHALLILEYLDRQLELMQRLRPEIIGHFDLFRLYYPQFPVRPDTSTPRPHLDALLADVWKRIERNVRYACAYGALFEANSASLRKGWDTAYPGHDVLQYIVQMGGRVCLSDDSHGISYIALNYLRMRDYLERANVDEIWYLEKDEIHVLEWAKQAKTFHNAPLRFARGTIAKRLTDAQWKEHVFWKNLQTL